MIALRPYQSDVLAEIAAAHERRLLVVAPTGSGKTAIACADIRQHPDEHMLFLAHRRELIHQTQRHLAEFGVYAGLILAGEPLDRMRGVQVASIQTLHSRCIRGGAELPPANRVYVDEAHHCPAQSYRAIVERYPDATIIGLTATPCRRDGRGLGGVFQRMIECPQVPDLIGLGYLVPTKVYAPSAPDLKGVRVRHGDYVERDLAERMDRSELVGDIVSHWHRLAERRKTVVFATSVAHSIHLRDEFCKSGVRAEHIDGATPKEERDSILARLVAGDLDLVTNCMLLTEGWDAPAVSCIVLARPTKSLGLYRQMIGRVLRPHSGKDHALVLDHAGATIAHGFVEDRIDWVLAPDRRADNRAHAARTQRETSRLVACTQCTAIRTAGKPCPNCGFMPKRAGQHLDVIDGELSHLRRDGTRDPQHYTPDEKRLFHAGLLHLALQRGNKPGAAAHRFREKFGHWPLDRTIVPTEPTPEVIAWDRHCRIRYAKAMQREARNG